MARMSSVVSSVVPIDIFFDDLQQEFIFNGLRLFASSPFGQEDLFQGIMDGFTEGRLFEDSSAEVQLESAIDLFCRSQDRFSSCQDLKSVLETFDVDLRRLVNPQVAWLCAFINSPGTFAQLKLMPPFVPHSGEAPPEFTRFVAC